MRKDAYVVGGAGFLGSHLVQRLVESGWRVAVIDPASAPAAGIHTVPSAVSAQSLDMLAAAGWRPSCVFHLGGSGSVGQAALDPAADFERTVMSTDVITRHLLGTDAKLVFVSSGAVYGDCGDAPIGESEAVRPISHYGKHKAAAEEQIRRSGLEFAIVRFFSIYGEGLRKQLLWDACRKFHDGRATFDGTGSEHRDWLHVSDAVRLLELAAQPVHRAVIVNGGTGVATRVEQALTILQYVLGAKSPPRFTGVVRAEDPKHLVADSTHARALGFSPLVRLEDGLERYARWFMEQQR